MCYHEEQDDPHLGMQPCGNDGMATSWHHIHATVPCEWNTLIRIHITQPTSKREVTA